MSRIIEHGYTTVKPITSQVVRIPARVDRPATKVTVEQTKGIASHVIKDAIFNRR